MYERGQHFYGCGSAIFEVTAICLQKLLHGVTQSFVHEGIPERSPVRALLSRPKPVLPLCCCIHRRSLTAQIDSLCTAWEWSPQDTILHALPLHHIHGIVNALYCPLRTGATVEFMHKFSPTAVWDRLMVCASVCVYLCWFVCVCCGARAGGDASSPSESTVDKVQGCTYMLS